jgi:hypothetical protein
MEGQKAIEDVIPFCWVDRSQPDAVLRFPNEPDGPLSTLISKCAEPQKTWFSFPLVKVKYTSGKVFEFFIITYCYFLYYVLICYISLIH